MEEEEEAKDIRDLCPGAQECRRAGNLSPHMDALSLSPALEEHFRLGGGGMGEQPRPGHPGQLNKDSCASTMGRTARLAAHLIPPMTFIIKVGRPRPRERSLNKSKALRDTPQGGPVAKTHTRKARARVYLWSGARSHIQLRVRMP